MRKQIKFYAGKNCEKLIRDMWEEIFDNLSVIPFEKEEIFEDIEDLEDLNLFLLVEETRRNDIVYASSTMHDGTIIESVDVFKSPVLQYEPSYQNLNGEIVEGSFFSCSKDVEFAQKADKFFSRLKKEFVYDKKYRAYISPNIDLSKAKLMKTYL